MSRITLRVMNVLLDIAETTKSEKRKMELVKLLRELYKGQTKWETIKFGSFRK
jgi:hypothetical protein